MIFLSIIVMIHELGHFLVAKSVGIYAEEFSIGMGPRLLKIQGKETEYSLRLLPIGGYVKFRGEDEESSDPRAFRNAKVWKRMAVISAGPIMNFVLAALLFTIMLMAWGYIVPEVGEVIPDSPAYHAGLEPGDRFVSLEGTDLSALTSGEAVNVIRSKILNSEGRPIDVIIDRNGSLHTLTVTPKLVEEDGQKYYQIGFVFATSKPGLFSAIGMSVKSTGVMLVNMIELLGGLFFKGQGVGDITGPVGIVREVGRAAQAGIDQIITLGIVITANLGLINLIPFPALDGGRLVLLLIEGLRGKPIDARKEGYIHLVGFVVLILLMLVVTYKDIFGF